jgi:hypothetical protein
MIWASTVSRVAQISFSTRTRISKNSFGSRSPGISETFAPHRFVTELSPHFLRIISCSRIRGERSILFYNNIKNLIRYKYFFNNVTPSSHFAISGLFSTVMRTSSTVTPRKNGYVPRSFPSNLYSYLYFVIDSHG